ncbi:MAG: glycosyltransferase [Anaerolineae bacterium]|nr:glycosyltransferase [Anaerolineae bacterium]
MTISVYIPSYNQKAYLIEAIDSVLAQTLRPDQLIIVDDCSSDGSPDVIRGYAAQYPDLITPIFHAQNRGVAQTRIDALNAVTSEYATYVDGDDRLLPHKLEREMVALQANPAARIAYSNVGYIDSDGNRTGQWAAPGEIVPQGDVFHQVFAREFPRRMLYRHELVHIPTWREVGFYDPRLGWLEDWEMRIRLTKQHQTVYVDEVLSEFRQHGGGLSSAKVTLRLAAGEYVIRKNTPLLADLDEAERAVIMKKLDVWLGHLNKRAAVMMLEERNDHARALRHYVRAVRQFPPLADRRLLVRILLPAFVYNGVRRVAQKVRG